MIPSTRGLREEPGLYGIKLPGGVVKFGQSKNVRGRVTSHLRNLQTYGVKPEAAFGAHLVNNQNPVLAERTLFSNLRDLGYRRHNGARETYEIGWDRACSELIRAIETVDPDPNRTSIPDVYGCPHCGGTLTRIGGNGDIVFDRDSDGVTVAYGVEYRCDNGPHGTGILFNANDFRILQINRRREVSA